MSATIPRRVQSLESISCMTLCSTRSAWATVFDHQVTLLATVAANCRRTEGFSTFRQLIQGLFGRGKSKSYREAFFSRRFSEGLPSNQHHFFLPYSFSCVHPAPPWDIGRFNHERIEPLLSFHPRL